MTRGIITAYYKGQPNHMKKSGYERLIDFINPDNIYFNIKYKKLPKLFSILKPLKIMPKLYYSLESEMKAIQENKIIHHLYGEDSFFLSGLISSKSKKQVVTFHSPSEKFKRIMPFITKFLLRNAEVIAISPSQKKFLSKYVKDKNKLHLIPHGVDIDYFKPKKIKKEKFILSVGHHLRDFETLVKAMSLVNKEIKDLKLVIVSSRCEFKSKNVVVKKGIPDEELFDLYQKALFQVIPLKSATANNALLEGFACGLPAIITNLNDIRFYTNNKGCLYYKKGNYKTLADEIIKLYNDKELLSKLSKQARKRAEELSWKNIAKQIMKVY